MTKLYPHIYRYHLNYYKKVKNWKDKMTKNEN